MSGFGPALFAQLSSDLVNQELVERASQSGATRKAVGWGSIEKLDSSNSDGPIAQSKRWNTLFGDVKCVPVILSSQMKLSLKHVLEMRYDVIRHTPFLPKG